MEPELPKKGVQAPQHRFKRNLHSVASRLNNINPAVPPAAVSFNPSGSRLATARQVHQQWRYRRPLF